MKFGVKKIKNLEEGRYTGKITKIENRSTSKGDETFTYTDIHIKDDKSGIEMKLGYPANISVNQKGEPGTGLAKFCILMGLKLHDSVELNGLIGKPVSFMVMLEETPKGKFARIVDGSVKPL